MKAKNTPNRQAQPAAKPRATAGTQPAGPTPATKTAATLEELARLVGRHVRTLQRQAKNPDAPQPDKAGRHSIRAWAEYLAANGKDGRSPDAPELVALKLRKLLAEVEQREHRLAALRGEFISIDQVREAWVGLVAQATSILRAKFENELPPILSGLDATGIQRECAKAVDEVLRCLHKG